MRSSAPLRPLLRAAATAAFAAGLAAASDSSGLRFRSVPEAPAGNPPTFAKVMLGKALFWDEQLSSTRTVACGTCHRPEAGGEDPRAVSGWAPALHPGRDGHFGTADDVVGSPGVPFHAASSSDFGMEAQVTRRHAPSVIDAADAPLLFRDGRSGDALVDPSTGDTLLASGAALEAQVLGPVESRVEMAGGPSGWLEITARLTRARPLALASDIPAPLRAWIGARGYPDLFREAFGSPAITPARVAMAIASYERTLVSDRAPIDSLRAGLALLRPDEEAGRVLFDSLGCSTCHSGARFTDDAFHHLGVRPAEEDSGRAAITGRSADLGAFRTPSLRNVALRAPYMHGGQLRTLEEVTTLYYRGGMFAGNLRDERMRPRMFTREQQRQLVAFLGRPLTDPRVERAEPPFDRPQLFTESGAGAERLDDAPGVPGAGGAVPEPHADEPPLLGHAEFTVSVDNARAGATATLVVDRRDPGPLWHAPTSTEVVRRTVVLSGVGPTGGFASADLALTGPSARSGVEQYARWYVRDPAAAGGHAVSPAIRWTLCAPYEAARRGEQRSARRSLRVAPPRAAARGDHTTFRWETTATGPVRAVVRDSLGSQVRGFELRRPPGVGVFVSAWDGRDSTGSPVLPGRYVLELRGARDTVRAGFLRER